MERLFTGWDEPALPLAARILLERYGAGGVADLGGAVAVLPGRRAGRRLKEILAEDAAEMNLRLVPPRVVTLGSLPELLYDPPTPTADAAEARLAWADALRRTAPRRLSSIFARLPEARSPDEWLSLARDLGRLHRDVARGGHRFADVAARCRSAAARDLLSWDDARRWEILAEVQDRYAEVLGTTGLTDPDLVRLEALRSEALSADADLWLVGVAEMPPVIRQAVYAVGDRVTALVHAPADVADAFDEAGCVRPDVWEDRPIPLAEGLLRVSDQPVHQAGEVARCLAELGGRLAADEISLGVPDPELIPWLEERLGDGGVTLRDAAGHDVGRTGPFRLLAVTAEMLGTARWESLAALARHPDVGTWISGESEPGSPLAHPGSWLVALDEWYGEHLPASLPAPGEVGRIPGAGTRQGGVVVQLAELLLERLPEVLAQPPTERPLSTWTVPTLQLLARSYVHHDLDPSRARDRQTLGALSLLADAVQAFQGVPPALDPPCTAATALRLFLDHAGGGRIPERPDPDAVEVLGWLELHLDDAPATVVAGVNEPGLPESVNADPFLPDSLRCALGLEDNRLRYARDAYRLTAMIHSTRFLRLVSGRRSGAGDPLRPSRLLFATDPGTVARRVRRFYREGPAGDDDVESEEGTVPKAPEGIHAQARDGSSDFELPPERSVDPERDPVVLRVTDFSRILADPFTFALERYRRCRSVDDTAREMDGLVFGSLAHAVLERFGAGDRVHSTDLTAVTERLEDLLRQEVRRRFGSGAGWAHPAVRIQVHQLRARLRRFARWHVDWIGQGWRVRAVECTTPDPGAPLEVDGTDAFIRARIDRIDHHPERNEWVVLDYKTGDRGDPPEKTHRRGRRGQREWKDLQLPLYRWLLPRIVDTRGDRVAPAGTGARVGYVLLPRDLDGVGISLADWDDELFSDALERARSVVRLIRAGPLEFDPGLQPRYSEPAMEALVGRGQLAVSSTGEEDG